MVLAVAGSGRLQAMNCFLDAHARCSCKCNDYNSNYGAVLCLNLDRLLHNLYAMLNRPQSYSKTTGAAEADHVP